MPPSVGEVKSKLPPFQNKRTLLASEQGTDDIITEILDKHRKYETDYDKIYPLFDTGNVEATCRGLWEFLKYNLTYDAEKGAIQSVKGPSGILQPGEKIDCKHYSLFSGGVLDAIHANENEAWNWCYRFVSYNSKPIATHVFVVVKDKGREIWVDPVLPAFNEKDPYTFFTDQTPMALYEINGIDKKGNAEIGSVSQKSAIVDVSKEVAESSFLTMVGSNLFGVKELLKRNPTVVNTQVRAYYKKNGLDFNHLLNFINS